MEIKKNIENFLKESINILNKIDPTKIEAAIQLIDETRNGGKKIFLVGNGGSASTASHFTADLSKWSTGDGNVPTSAICLIENMPAVSALVNDNGWENVYTEQLKNMYKEGDIIIGFSVHGGKGSEKAGEWSQNLTKAIDFVHNNGGKSIGVTGFDGGAMKQICTVNINVPIESTPQVEGIQVLLTHLMAEELRKIAVGEKISILRK